MPGKGLGFSEGGYRCYIPCGLHSVFQNKSGGNLTTRENTRAGVSHMRYIPGNTCGARLGGVLGRRKFSEDVYVVYLSKSM